MVIGRDIAGEMYVLFMDDGACLLCETDDVLFKVLQQCGYFNSNSWGNRCSSHVLSWTWHYCWRLKYLPTDRNNQFQWMSRTFCDIDIVIITSDGWVLCLASCQQNQGMSTHWSLVTTYDDIDLGQHWSRNWLVAWRQQTITWTNVVLSLIAYWGIHLIYVFNRMY